MTDDTGGGGHGPEPSKHESFAKVPPSISQHLLCGDCHRLYALLDEVERDGGRPLRGVGAVATALGWQTDTAKRHTRHLADAGIVGLEPEPEKAWGDVRFRVLHNPARGRISPTLTYTKQFVEAVPMRWRPKSKLSDVLKTDAECSAPSVRPDDALPEGAPHRAFAPEAPESAAHRAFAPSEPQSKAQRTERSDTDAQCAAPSVRLSSLALNEGRSTEQRVEGARPLDDSLRGCTWCERLAVAWVRDSGWGGDRIIPRCEAHLRSGGAELVERFDTPGVAPAVSSNVVPFARGCPTCGSREPCECPFTLSTGSTGAAR